MKIFSSQEDRLVEEKSLQEATKDNCLWIDLLSPSDEEKKRLGGFLGIKIPTKEEMQEIESSSRLYKENDALIMTINAIVTDNSHTKIANLTFILKGNVLATLRYDEFVPLSNFSKTACVKPSFSVKQSISLLLAMIEAFIEKIADTFELISASIEGLSQKIFSEKTKKNRDLSGILISMGVQGEFNAKTRESLSSIARMIGFVKFNLSKDTEKQFESRVETLLLDAGDLKDQSTFLEHKINFILDASLGLINIEQNNIIKIFSIAAVVLLPPTLIATVYGMNFQYVPEFQWKYGYPFVLIIMILSAIAPYVYFKKKGWL